MRCNEELVERLASRHNEKIGPLSSQAYDELVLAVRKDPEAFLADDADRAFQRLGQTLAANAQSRTEEEFLDDDSYEAARAKRLERLEAGCREALDLDSGCLDAKTVIALASNKDADQALIALDALWDGTRGDEQVARLGGVANVSAWDDVSARPLLRLLAARARTQLDTARYRLASASCARLVELDPTDELGARFTWAVALARLEDEPGFDQLAARFDRKGNAWSHLARTLLMFKLDRMGAARRDILTRLPHQMRRGNQVEKTWLESLVKVVRHQHPDGEAHGVAASRPQPAPDPHERLLRMRRKRPHRQLVAGRPVVHVREKRVEASERRVIVALEPDSEGVHLHLLEEPVRQGAEKAVPVVSAHKLASDAPQLRRPHAHDAPCVDTWHERCEKCAVGGVDMPGKRPHDELLRRVV